MGAFALLFTMAAIGIAETSYLIDKRKAAEKPVCPIGGDCGKVLTSKYNKVFGFIHNDQAGRLFYVGVGLLTALLYLGYGPSDLLNGLLMLAVAGGLLMSAVLIFLMWRVIKAWCFWCLMSAATIVVMAGVLISKGFALIP